MAKSEKGMYEAVIEKLFFARYKPGQTVLEFDRTELDSTPRELGLDIAKNLGDVVYAYKYRRSLPKSILETASAGFEWRIANIGRSRYSFALLPEFRIKPDPTFAETKILDATPGMIAKYAFSDEQALLAKLRYNRLIDVFTGVTCYSLQNHLRTSVQVEPDSSAKIQIEVDEIYVGVDRRGAHHVFPVQAKGGRDKIGVQQIEQDLLFCAQKFKESICTPIAAQFMQDEVIALFSFESSGSGIKKNMERHYRLVAKEEFSDADIKTYRERLEVDHP